MPSSRHAEWFELVEVSGPFLTLPVLERVFPQGLDAADPDHAAKLRLAHEEWAEERSRAIPDTEIHEAWVRFVLTETLEFTPEVLVEGDGVPGELSAEVPEQDTTLRPDLVIFDPEGTDPRRPRLLLQVYPPEQDMEGQVADSSWAASPAERMTQLCRATEVRLGLLTNGERWMLVDAPRGETAGYVSFYASLFSDEALTLRAFRSLLGARRFFAVDDSDTLEAMLTESATYQAEVTAQLGAQVRRAVEVLVQTLDRADADTGRKLLQGVPEAELYEASLTVMMRLVFLFFAEENDLLPLSDELYQANYAASTLRAQLREEADRVGIEVLERRQDAWCRLLATFRAIHGGVDHEQLHLPAYGGSLFDPDRFCFLEGRAAETTWRTSEATPLPIDNRTVLHLLDALQLLRMKGRAGSTEARRLSFRSLDIEQIGHVYEMLLDHTAVRALAPGIGLVGTSGTEPEVGLDELEELRARGVDSLVDHLVEETKKSRSSIEKALAKDPDPAWVGKLRIACGENHELIDRVFPFQALMRTDPWGEPVVIPTGTVYVTSGTERRSTGTYYTPRALTEEIVTYALEPIVYRGPAEGTSRQEWELLPPAELLEVRVCDPAMGSGAFLVQVVRFLSERVLEAWDKAEEAAGAPITPEGGTPSGAVSELLVPTDPEERAALARRLVADRCIYGVDVNPLAVEMAKLSLWLVTLAKGRPFSFLDHALRCGDSLLGVHDLEQIRAFHPDPSKGGALHATLDSPIPLIEQAVARALELRRDLESFTVKDVRDAERKAELQHEAERATEQARLLGDLVIGAALSTAEAKGKGLDGILKAVAPKIPELFAHPGGETDLDFRERAWQMLNAGKPNMRPDRRPFHWPVEFPEVFSRERSGFDAMVGNPPYVGNKYWKERLGDDFQPYFASVLQRALGKPDLVVLFVWRMTQLIRDGGIAGSLATQSITEVDSKNLMQAVVLNDSTIVHALRARPWPGAAAVLVSVLWLTKGRYVGACMLDGLSVLGIDADLRASFGGEPAELADSLFAFEGVHNARGLGFVVSADDSLCEHRDLFKPYVSGEDLTQRDPRRPVRSVLDLTGWSEADLNTLPADVARFLHDVVRPTRTDALLKSYKGLEKRWWTFWNTREDGYRVVRARPDCVVVPAVAKYLTALRLPSRWVYTNKVVVFDVARPDVQSLLLSPAFDVWAKKYGGSLGEGRVMKIAAVVRTFPVSVGTVDAQIAAEWQATALAALDDFGPGLSDVLNRIHDPLCDAQRVVQLRLWYQRIHADVMQAYGWTDLGAATLAFEATDEGVRWSLSSETQGEVLLRLHKLNRDRHEAR